MDSVQDGGQQNMKSDHDFPPQMEGSRINSEMNNFSHSSGEGPESYAKMPEGMHMNQMQNYPGYSRSGFGIGEQHGGMMAGSSDYSSQSAQFSGHFPHNPVRSSYPGMPKSSMSPGRSGMMPPGVGMPGPYSSQRMMPTQSQSGPTPTLNQLLQTNTGQRFPGNYSDYSSQGKTAEQSGASAYPIPQGWSGNQRAMGTFSQTPGMGGTPYKSQVSSMGEGRHPSGMGSGQGPGPGGYYQGQYMTPAMAANAQRYMAGQVRPGHMPMSSHGYSQQMPPHSLSYSPSMPSQPSQLASPQQQQQQQHMYHGQQQQPQPPGQPPSQPSPTPSQQQAAVSSSSSSSTSASLRPPSSHSQGSSPTQASPAPQGMVEQASNQTTSVNMKKPEEVTESAGENCHSEDHKREHAGNDCAAAAAAAASQSQLGVTSLRAVPSPAGSTGSRSDTPASNSGAQVGSPMPPRPPSSQVESQNHTSHSPMATQAGYNQPMMPPPMPGQTGYPGAGGGKMAGGQGMGGTPVPPHFPQYASQYSQGGFRGQPGMGGGMPGTAGSYPQAMYNNGPNSSQMGPGMYNAMMSRGMHNYNTPYGPMNSHYGTYNNHMGPGQPPGPGPGSGPSPGQSSAGPVPMGGPGQMMGAQAGMSSSGPPGIGMVPGGKGAQAAAQAALLAAASSAGSRMPGRGMPMSPRMMGPQGNGSSSPGMMNHMGNLGNPSLAGMSNQIQQITSSSVTGAGKPSSPAGSCPIPPSSSNNTSSALMDNAAAPSAANTAGHMGAGNSNSGGGETTNLMSPLSGSDTQESSRPSSTATPGQPADTGNSVSDMVGSEGSGSVPGSDSTSVDSGFHSAADHSEKPPSESIPIHSSSPSNPVPPPLISAQSEEEASQDGMCKVMGSGSGGSSASIPTGLHASVTTTTVTNASVDMTVTQSATAMGVGSSNSSSQSAGSQTNTTMMKTPTSSSPATSIPNGPHYPHHHHPHPAMGGYPGMGGPRGPGPMGGGGYHPMMGGYGAHPHHPSAQQQQQHPVGNMGPYGGMSPAASMGPGNMPNSSAVPGMRPGSMPHGNMPPSGSMPPGSMPPGSMPPGSMAPGSMPPGSMPPGSMPPGSMPGNMPPGNMPSGMGHGMMSGHMPGSNSMTTAGMSSSNMTPESMPPGRMPGSMAPGSMPGNMAPGSMPGNMAPGNMAPENMPPGRMPGNMGPSSMAPGNMPGNMTPGNMPPGSMAPGNMTPGNMPGNMAPGNMPPGNMAPGNVAPESVPQGGAVPQGNMAAGANMPPGSIPQGSLGAENMPSGVVPNNLPQNNVPNNQPHGAMGPGTGLKTGNRGGMPNHMQASTLANSLASGSAPNHMASGAMSGGDPPGRPGAAEMNNSNSGNMVSQKTVGSSTSATSVDQPVVVEKKKKDEGVMVGAGPSVCEDYENSSSPGWPGMPKNSDVTRLYDMGNERERRPFLDRLFAFLEEKGTPLTTMPMISKQPLDLFLLYHCVREKGGMVEVNNSKRWKEICASVNIGTSGSAAFTLKRNYIRYLFAFECKFDLGGLDPAPILQEIESHTERKRDRKRVPSPGSQNSQDAFQQPPTPNNQMMDGYPGGMPPPYMQGPDGQMIPTGMGGHPMMPNMGHHPNMMPAYSGTGPPGMMGHGPPGMMMNSGMPNAGPASMMGGGMGPQGRMMNSGGGAMMGPGGGVMGGPPGMHVGPNSYGSAGGPPSSMLGSGSGSATINSSSMGPSPGPPPTMAAGNSVSSGTTSVVAGNSGGGGGGSSMGGAAPPTSGSSISLPPTSTPNSRPPTADSVSVQDPFADEPTKSSSPATFQHRAGGPTPSPTPGGFPSPGPPTSTGSTGFGSRPSSTSNPNAAAFPGSPASEPPSSVSFRRSGGESFQSGGVGMFPGRSEGARFPFGHDSPSHAGQSYRPGSDSSDPSYSPRFAGQQTPFPSGAGGEGFNSAHPFPSQGPGFGPRMPGQEHYSGGYAGVRPPMSHEGSFSGPGREGVSWSPMHGQRAFPPSSGGSDCALSPFGRSAHRGSPHAREKVLSKLQKAGSVQANNQFSPKKEITFPPDSVEGAQPSLSKRRRLTHKDLAPVEAWRLMMALKSGLLAESTWAIDTLNILLFDDATVTYFNLAHMPGLLEVLTEHFRAGFIHAFDILRDRELHSDKSLLLYGCACQDGQLCEDEDGSPRSSSEELAELVVSKSEAYLDGKLYGCNYTWVSRQDKAVAKEEGNAADMAHLERKRWDLFSDFSSGKQHWLKGGGDITRHVVPCFESGATHRLLTDLFYPQHTAGKGRREAGQKRKAAHVGGFREGRCAGCPNSVRKQCSSSSSNGCRQAKRLKECSEQGVVGKGDVLEKHSSMCSSFTEHKNHVVISKVEIKEELAETDLHRCESDDSLPPPVLPAATQDCPSASDESGLVNDSQNGLEEKTTPPDLTCEKVEGEEVKIEKGEGEESVTKSEIAEEDDDNNAKKEEPAEIKDNTETEAEEEKTAVENQSEKSENEMTAEIVAMMTKEQDEEMEEEAYRHDDAPLTIIQSDQEEMGRRCVAISNIFRSLSCIPGNESLLSKHQGFMLMVGQLLLLHHRHPPRPQAKPAPPLLSEDEAPPPPVLMEEKKEVNGKGGGEEEGEEDWATSPEWWWDMLECVRENLLVVLANISSHMHMRDMHSHVCLPILDGLLHWMVCPSSVACDPLPSAATDSQLSPQRLAMEALCKLCIHGDNVDLLLATPPFSRILLLLGRLMRFLSDRHQQVPREFSIVLLSRLVQADAVAARAIALQHPSISLLLDFLESAEQSAMAAASQPQQRGPVSCNSPEVLGTSLDMLCRAASILLHIARVPENRKLFLYHQNRLLALVMSQILDAGVTRIISDVLFECSQSDLSPT